MKARRAKRPNDGYNARDFAVSRKTEPKISDVSDNDGRAFALRAKLRMHVIESSAIDAAQGPAMRSVPNATRDA